MAAVPAAINHYENVDAVQQQPCVIPAQQPIEPNLAQIINLQQNNISNRPPLLPSVQQYHPPYRNEIYDRTGGYDIPRNVRSQNFYANVPNNNNSNSANGTQRRSNLHLDFRQRCPPPAAVNHQQMPPPQAQQQHQRNFDDTESCYYGSNNGNNNNSNNNSYGTSMYERIRDEPVYQNSANNMYGRLDVIGHGIGRIERHLSSSCGNIDHYNVGGHYAVLSHSHLNSMVMNQTGGPMASGSAQNPREGVKSLFSCLGGENSQSMSSINDSDNSQNSASISSAAVIQQQQPQRSTGAIPKTKNKQSNKVSPKPAVVLAPPSTSSSSASSSIVQSTNSVAPPLPPPIPKTNFSKSSLQYLLMNKWLPLGPDYKIIDFNFMFSRNCSSPGHCNAAEGVVQFNGQAEMVEPGMFQPPREYPMMNNGQYPRIIRNAPQLSRLRESDENVQYENVQRGQNAFRARSESPNFNGTRQRPQQDDPFRNWSFNFENNSFRPAGAVQQQNQQPQREVKRITDGTLAAKDFQEQNQRKELPVVIIEQDNQPQQPQDQLQPQPSTSKSSSPSTSENSNPSTSTSSSSSTTNNNNGQLGKTGEMKKSENYDNLASLQLQDPLPSTSSNGKQRKKKSTESQSSDSVTLAEEDEDNDDNDDPFDELESDID